MPAPRPRPGSVRQSRATGPARSALARPAQRAAGPGQRPAPRSWVSACRPACQTWTTDVSPPPGPSAPPGHLDSLVGKGPAGLAACASSLRPAAWACPWPAGRPLGAWTALTVSGPVPTPARRRRQQATTRRVMTCSAAGRCRATCRRQAGIELHQRLTGPSAGARPGSRTAGRYLSGGDRVLHHEDVHRRDDLRPAAGRRGQEDRSGQAQPGGGHPGRCQSTRHNAARAPAPVRRAARRAAALAAGRRRASSRQVSASPPAASPRACIRRLSVRSATASPRHGSHPARCTSTRSRSASSSSPSISADRRCPRCSSPPRSEPPRWGRGWNPGLPWAAMFQGSAQLGPAAVDPAAHGAQLDAQRVGYFLVGQALDVAEDDRGPVLGRESLERILDVAVQVPVVEGLRGRGPPSPSRAAVSSPSPSNRIRCLRRAMSRNRLVVIRCSQPSKVPGV